MKLGPLYVAPAHIWFSWSSLKATVRTNKRFYVFRNMPGVIKRYPGKFLPRRWGFGFFGLIEFGSRG